MVVALFPSPILIITGLTIFSAIASQFLQKPDEVK
jgi:hypothetical protein